LIGGIELVADGHKIAWSIAGYLASLTNSVTALLAPKSDPVASSPKVVSHAA
jgi:F-type H+-transporting ATPase subunit b